jgi:hydrogenase-4 component B
MQYTGASFSEMISGVFSGAVLLRRDEPRIDGIAPRPSSFRADPTETVLDGAIRPALHVIAISFAFLHKLQHGRMHIYMLYMFVTLFLLMFQVR